MCLLIDEQSHFLFAGTDQGIFAYNVDSGANGPLNQWQCYSMNLPNSFITGLDINRCTGKIYASTYGRGAYEADLPADQNAFGDGSGGMSDAGDIDYITTSTTWTLDKDETRSIYVPAGVSLTVSNCTLNMSKDKSIIVDGKLIVDGATITNECGSMWYGIQAHGNGGPFVPQSYAYDGWVVIRNQSVIKNARYGVTNCDISDSLLAGGIVQCVNSSFINDYISALFFPYQTVTSSTMTTDDLSCFVNCTFSLDSNYHGDTLGYPFLCHAYLTGVQGVTFKGCQFLNRDTKAAEAGWGQGIYSYNGGGFYLQPYCSSGFTTSAGACVSGTWIRSRFCGFQYGINVVNGGGGNADPTVSIDQADFDSVSVGVNVLAASSTSTTRCGFNVGHGAGVVDVTDTPSLYCYQNIGIMIQNSFDFKMASNAFYGHNAGSAFQNYGAVVANTFVVGTGALVTNTVYDNYFDSLTYGVYSIGNNRGSTVGSAIDYTGLEILCNNFGYNGTDIKASLNPIGAAGQQGVASTQASTTGYVPISAGNTFSNSPIRFKNNATPVNYYYCNCNAAAENPRVAYRLAQYKYEYWCKYGCLLPINITERI